MKFYKFLSVTFFLCLVLGASLPAVSAKDEWIKARSKNFALIGDASEKNVRAVALTLEQFRETFQQNFINADFDSQPPLNVVVFKSHQQLLDLKQINENDGKTALNGRFFQTEEAGNCIVVSAETGKTSQNFASVFHEYIHFLVNENFGRTYLQPWFNEGFAEYYETAQIGNAGKITLGNVNDEHLLVLRQNKLIPLETFFETDYYSLQKQGNHGAGIFYAQSWALMHYLMRGDNAARTSQFNKFIQLVLNGKRQKYAFEEAFQIDYQTLESELKKYIEQKSFRTEIANLKTKSADDIEIQSAIAPDSEAKIVMGELLYQSNRLAEAVAALGEAAKFEGFGSASHSLLGLVKLKQGKPDEAIKYLEKAIALDDKNYLAHYRYAFVLSREGMTDYGFVSNYTAAQAARIRAALDKSIALNPNFPESYNLYAFVNYVRNEAIDRAIEYINLALKFAPGNQRYQMRLAELSLLKEDFEKARHYARKIFETAPDERLRVYAKNTIYTIDTYQSQLESLRNPGRKRLHEVTDKPLSEEESARLNWLAMLEGINQNLRRLKQDEKRVLGYLTQIECGANEIKYSVKTDNRTLTLSSETFETLKLISFSADASGGQIGCGTIKKDAFAVIGYRPSTKESAKSAGEIVSIEFVPESFKFLY